MTDYPHPEPPPTLPEGPLDTQPVAWFVGGLAGVVNLGLVAATLLGWLDLTGEQTAAVVAFVTAAAAFTATTLRRLVTCRATLAKTQGST